MKVILVVNMGDETAIAVVGAKGQIVIPQKLRKELQITAKTKLAIYRMDDKLVVTKLVVPPLCDDLTELFRKIDEQNKGKKSTEKESQTNRHEKHTSGH